jgi:hypothetical protein
VREQRGETVEPLAEAFETLRSAPVPTDPSEPSELWRLLQSLPGARDAERAYEALHTLMGPAWLDEGAAHLQHAPPAMSRLLVDALHAAGFEAAVETNGTRTPPAGLDWICVSPKAGADLVLLRGNELKLVYPQQGALPGRFEGLDFTHFFLQPMDGPQRDLHTRQALDYCLAHPPWRLSLQTHKLLNIP